jgi:hypothetical protein
MIRSSRLSSGFLAASVHLCSLLAAACQGADESCWAEPSGAAASTASAPAHGVGAITELVLRLSNLTDSLTLASAERLVRVTPAGEVVFADPEGEVPVTLSSEERAQLAAWLNHPSFSEFLGASVLPCSGASGARASLGVRFGDGREQVIQDLLSCVSSPGEDLGQIDYAFRGLTDFLAQVGRLTWSAPCLRT